MVAQPRIVAASREMVSNLEQNREKTGVRLLTAEPAVLIVSYMCSGRVRRLVRVLAALVAGATCTLSAVGVVSADEPVATGEIDGVEVALTDVVVPPVTEPPPSTAPAPAVGEVGGVPVAVGEALVPGGAATVEVPADRVEVGEVDGVEVGVIEPPVPTVVTTRTAAPDAAPAVERAAAEPTVALVLAAWG